MRTGILHTFASVGVGMLLFGAVQTASATTFDFEGLTDGDTVTNQFAAQGVTISNGTILTAGVSLNEFELPPKSGSNVLSDSGSPLSFSFTIPVLSFGGLFTYLVPTTVSAFDAGSNLLGSVTSAFSSSLALSGDAGSSPNELLQLAGIGNIARVDITGDPAGGSFVVDDVQFSAIPEPGTLLLTGSILAFFVMRRLSQVRQR
jgi:hypothetical protein